MKTSNESIKTHPTVPTLIMILPFLSVVTVLFLCVLKGYLLIEIVKLCIMTFLLTSATVFYIRSQQAELRKKKYFSSILCISYLISLAFLMLIPNSHILCFWMLGGLLVSMLIDLKLGLFIYFNLTLIITMAMHLSPDAIIHFLLTGIIMICLSGALKEKSTVIYASVIILSTNITLAFVLNNFIFEPTSNFNYLSSFFCILVIILTSYVFNTLYQKITPLISEPQEEMEIMEVIPEEVESFITEDTAVTSNEEMTVSASDLNREEEPIPYIDINSTSYDVLLEEGNILLTKLKETSEELFRHSVFIGDLSERAALLLGADAKLAKAGGLYHEIGRINGSNYIEEGLKIASEYSFPKELINILRQHNIKFEKPTSVEAAIVMLSDTIVSTLDYINEAKDNRFTSDKIIDNIFQMRMDKGTLDETGLTVKNYKILKEFYQNAFSEGR